MRDVTQLMHMAAANVLQDPAIPVACDEVAKDTALQEQALELALQLLPLAKGKPYAAVIVALLTTLAATLGDLYGLLHARREAVK